jgi:DNA ligase-1
MIFLSRFQVKVAVSLYAFDLLYLNGQPLIHDTLRSRREVLKKSFKEVPGKFQFATSLDSSDTNEIEVKIRTSIFATKYCEKSFASK